MQILNFQLDEMPKGLINIQTSPDENVIFTFSYETIAIDVLMWLKSLDGLDNDTTEIHNNKEKECFEIVIDISKFTI